MDEWNYVTLENEPAGLETGVGTPIVQLGVGALRSASDLAQCIRQGRNSTGKLPYLVFVLSDVPELWGCQQFWNIGKNKYQVGQLASRIGPYSPRLQELKRGGYVLCACATPPTLRSGLATAHTDFYAISRWTRPVSCKTFQARPSFITSNNEEIRDVTTLHYGEVNKKPAAFLTYPTRNAASFSILSPSWLFLQPALNKKNIHFPSIFLVSTLPIPRLNPSDLNFLVTSVTHTNYLIHISG